MGRSDERLRKRGYFWGDFFQGSGGGFRLRLWRRVYCGGGGRRVASLW